MNSSELKGYLTGLIIGDGCIGSGVTKRAFAIKSTCQEFINKICKDLGGCTNFRIGVSYSPAHYSDGCDHKASWELHIAAHPYFNKKYHHFYDDNRKCRVSKEAADWLTPAGIANWYMSDGYVCLVGKTKGVIKNRRVDFCTDRYDMVSIRRLQKALNRFGIETSAVKRANRWRIRVKASSYERFIWLVEPYIVPQMRYKLWLGYPEKPSWMSEKCWDLQEDLKSAITLTDKAEG